ncbi:MAG: acyl-ACP--UDP-N-acetylglucosamine O-acyltransferase [Caulobacteraceae bacterium]
MPNIHPTAIVHDGAGIAPGVEIGPFCIVGPKVKLGEGVRLISHVVVDGLTSIGANCVVHPFAYLGGPPQHLAHKGEETSLVVGERNMIREHVTMHLGSMAGTGVTTVGSASLFMVGAHIAHDCVIGDRITMGNNATLAGHVEVGDHVFLSGLTGVHQFTRIGHHAFIGGISPVTRDVIPYGSVWGNPARLQGLNLVGLKRQGFTRDEIKDLRTAYRLLTAEEGAFQERLEDVGRVYAGNAKVMEIIDFIRADASRPICLPGID